MHWAVIYHITFRPISLLSWHCYIYFDNRVCLGQDLCAPRVIPRGICYLSLALVPVTLSTKHGHMRRNHLVFSLLEVEPKTSWFSIHFIGHEVLPLGASRCCYILFLFLLHNLYFGIYVSQTKEKESTCAKLTALLILLQVIFIYVWVVTLSIISCKHTVSYPIVVRILLGW